VNHGAHLAHLLLSSHSYAKRPHQTAVLQKDWNMKTQVKITVRYIALAVALASVGYLSLGARAAVELPTGTYKTTITADDIPAFFPPEAADILVGVWEIEFTDAGIAFVTKDDDLVVTSRYISNPVRLILQDQEGRLACLPPGAGVFAWVLEDDQLTITEVQDTCAGRALVLTAHPLLKVQ
jgi:hypothetical protein